jgi:hypothetical protein
VVVDRPDPGGVDQPHPLVEQRQVQAGGDPGDAERVARVALLGHEAGDLAEVVPLGPAVGEVDQQGLIAPLQHGRDGGQRQHPDRQHLAADERVDQARLAPLELADDGDLEVQRLQPAGRLGGLLAELAGAEQPRRLGQGRQRLDERRAPDRLHVSPPGVRLPAVQEPSARRAVRSELHRW